LTMIWVFKYVAELPSTTLSLQQRKFPSPADIYL
jgi:hypothetical protein